MATVNHKCDLEPVNAWYAAKMNSDLASIQADDAVSAFSSSLIGEQFPGAQFNVTSKRGDIRVTKAIFDLDGSEVSVVFHARCGDKSSINYGISGSDQAVSLVVQKILPLLRNPSKVQGHQVFPRDALPQVTDKSEHEEIPVEFGSAALLPAKVVVIGIWATFGLALWLQILVRVHLYVAAVMAASALSGKRNDEVGRMIYYANSFWLRGFRNISDFGTRRADHDENTALDSAFLLSLESAAALIFYGALYIVLFR